VMTSSDPAIGLPKADVWVQELKTRLDSGAFKGSLAKLEKQ
jgi:hypothetical protein